VVSKGPTFEQTRDYLEGQGFKINREDVPGPRNRVVEVTPCEAPRGSTITVKVGNGQRGGSAPASSNSPAPDNTGNGDGDGGNTSPGLPGLPGTN